MAAPVSATLSPVSLGGATVQIDSDGLRNGSTTFSVTITVGSLIALALIGGLLGGGLRYLKEHKLLLLKFMGGLAGGFVLAAVYVFGVVPIAQPLPLNVVSVTAISLLGGYFGTLVLDWLWGKLT